MGRCTVANVKFRILCSYLFEDACNISGRQLRRRGGDVERFIWGTSVGSGPGVARGRVGTTHVIKSSQVEQILAEHTARLRVCLQHASGDSDGPEEGSDAWLLLHALIGSATIHPPNDAVANSKHPSNDTACLPSVRKDERKSGFAQTVRREEGDPVLFARFEQSGRWLAEQGGKLDVRLQGLQRYIDALALELKDLFNSLSDEQDRLSLLVEATSRLYQLQSSCTLALTRGYQSVMHQRSLQRDSLAQQLVQRFGALQRINGTTNSTMDLDQTLEIITKVVAEELHVDLCTIFFYDELQRVLTLRATNGPRPLGGMHFTLRLGEGYSGWVADKGWPLIVRDALADSHFSTEVRTYSTEYHGLMAIPVIFFGNEERLIGVISVQSAGSREFTTSERNFLEVVAGIIAINIENGRLYEQTDEQLRRKVHELATIHRVSSIIASTLNLDEVLQIITTHTVHLNGAERSCIFELDPDRQHLHVVAHYGLNEAYVRSIEVPVGHCCAGRTVQTGQPSMAVDCFYDDPHCFISKALHSDPAETKSSRASGVAVEHFKDPGVSSEIHSVLCVPLQVKRKVLGCICIYSSHRHLLSHEQLQLDITFANEAAIAIENARLFEEARRGLELKSVLLRELHHRVKNNLATVASILSLQRRRTKSPEVRHTLAESVNRVQGLAATHDLLSHEDVSEARVDDIARKIVGVANANLRTP